jgi:thiol-disulfide isomerase/thioredoxin
VNRLLARLAGCALPAALAVLAGGVLAGCSGSDVGGGSAGQGFVSGTGAITTLRSADRSRPGSVAGTTIEGREVALSDFRGKVVVLNVWGSWCPPCRAEAPTLAAAARRLAAKDVVFLGINSRDPERAGPRAFERRYKTPYPSIYDPSGRTLLAFRGTLTPNSIPSTVIIDRQGRVAASVIGSVSATTLEDLVHDVSGGSA